MCGMTGWLSFNRNLASERTLLQSMTNTLALRGPDSQGVWIDGPVGLGHRRLSVIDLAGGHQPMIVNHNQQYTAVIVYTGEVYNFQELKSTLQARGHHFDTRSDTEVVIHAYLEWGVRFVDQLNGMYAFAIWDRLAQELLLVRDRMGVKPLYYYQTDDGIIFGSEIKALLANPLVPRKINADGLREIFEMVKTPGHVVFSDIHEVLPGEMLRVRKEGLFHYQYWQLQSYEHTDTLQNTIQHTRYLLEDIIDKQTVADVPLCCLLSGGLDSSVITSLASRKRLAEGKDNIHSFSVDFLEHNHGFTQDEVRGTPDAPFVRDLVKRINSTHTEIIIDSREMANSQLRCHIVKALDLPPAFWGDMLPSISCLFQAIRKHATVALSGESADEIFGGYVWFHDMTAINAHTFPWLASITAKYFDGKTLFADELLNALNLDEFVNDSYQHAIAQVPNLPNEDKINQRMRQISHLNLTRFVQTLLDRKDRLSMARGLEVRVPFCDHRLVEYAFNIPWQMKTFDGREKSILRAASRDLLPNSISERVKSPYPSTQDPAYEQELRHSLHAIMADNNAPIRPFIDNKRIIDTLAKPLGKLSPVYDRTSMELVIGLNLWLSEYKISISC